MAANKETPIFELEKIPVESLYKMERENRGKDLAYIQELEYTIHNQQAEIDKLKGELITSGTTAEVNRLKILLNIATAGVAADKKYVRNELYKDAYMAYLKGAEVSSSKKIAKLKTQLRQSKNTISELIYKLNRNKE